MKKLDIGNIIEIASIVFICFVVAYLVRDDILKTNKIEYLEKEIEYYKQKASNQELIDSLTFNIVKQDSIITATIVLVRAILPNITFRLLLLYNALSNEALSCS